MKSILKSFEVIELGNFIKTVPKYVKSIRRGYFKYKGFILEINLIFIIYGLRGKGVSAE